MVAIAPCVGHDDLFFPSLKRGTGGRAALREAARICHSCPVLKQCDERAQRFHQNDTDAFFLFGLWAGTMYWFHKSPETIIAYCSEPDCDADPDGGLGRCNPHYLKYAKKQRKAQASRAAGGV